MTNQAHDAMFDILDQSIDDLADLPEFKVPDTGMYRLAVTAEPKPINDKPAVVAKFRVINLIELADDSIPEEERAKENDKFDIPFILRDKEGNKSEIAEGRMKEFLAPFSAHFEEKNNKALIMNHLNSEVIITAKITKKQRKDDADKYSAQVSDIVIE